MGETSHQSSSLKAADKFIKEYYEALKDEPNLLTKYYKSNSTLGRPEKDGSMSTTITAKRIIKKIAPHKYSYYTVNRKLHAQKSGEKQIVVLVIGNMSMTGKDDTAVRTFSQTFVLVQENDEFFILNDILRYVDNVVPDDVAAEPAPSPPPPPHVPAPAPAPAPAKDNNGQVEVPADNDMRNLTMVSRSRKSQHLKKTKNSEKALEVQGHLFKFPPLENAIQKPGYISLSSTAKQDAQRKAMQDHRDSSKSGHLKRNDGSSSSTSNTQSRLSESESRSKVRQSTKRRSRAIKGKKIESETDRKNLEGPSMSRFAERNKKYDNIITIDLHDQTVDEAKRLLKIHLHYGSRMGSVLTFHIITGRGNHSGGYSVMKKEIMNFLKEQGVGPIEKMPGNPGMLIIKIGSGKTFTFINDETSRSSSGP